MLNRDKYTHGYTLAIKAKKRKPYLQCGSDLVVKLAAPDGVAAFAGTRRIACLDSIRSRLEWAPAPALESILYILSVLYLHHKARNVAMEQVVIIVATGA